MNTCFLRWFTLVTAALLLTAPGCATSKSNQLESYLAASGFKKTIATTAVQERQLQSLPPSRFSTLKRKGQTYYVYPNRAKNVLFVGQKAQYQNFQNLMGDAEASSDYKLTHTWQDGGVNPMWDNNDDLSVDMLGGFDF